MKRITPILLSLLFIQCETGSKSSVSNEATQVVKERDPAKVYNLMGEELNAIQPDPTDLSRLNANLEEAKINLNTHPDSLELIIWYGRRLGYTGRYLEAIDVFSQGIEKFPASYRLRRHRGHRYITTRQFEKAIQDFEMAAYYSVNAPNAIEPDGIPNKLNKPLSNDKFNIWYHYGLAHYLSGRYDKAISAYNRCLEFSDNDDLLVATTYWLFMTYKKIGNPELANQLLIPINAKMRMIENDDYLRLLLLFKGEKKVEDLIKKAFPEGQSINSTLGYGIGNWYQQQGDIEKANEIFLKVLDSPNWNKFGYISTEAELIVAFPVPVS